MKILLRILSLLFLLIPSLISAQELGLWENVTTKKTVPNRWEGIKLNRKILNKEVLTVILSDLKERGVTTIAIPHPSGGEQEFDVTLSNIMAPGLKDKYPNIYALKGVNKNSERVRIDVGPNGMHATIFSQQGTYLLDPESVGSTNYVSYFEKDYISDQQQATTFTCHNSIAEAVFHKEAINARTSSIDFTPLRLGDQYVKHRIAIAATSDYYNFYGSVESTMQGIVGTLNEVTASFEQEVGVTFELVADNDRLIFPTPESHPSLDLRSSGQIINESTTVISEIIGNENYDVGHVFTNLSGGGVAFVASSCRDDFKGGGTSGGNDNPERSTFIRIVAHEIGHQFSAQHTNAIALESSNPLRYEVGAGTTFMKNSGELIVPHFHMSSVNLMTQRVENTSSSCGTLMQTGNTPPEVSVPAGDFVIPINTPFVLEADGSDTDGDPITYSWEQIDETPKAENLPDNRFGSEETIFGSVEEFMASDLFITQDSLDALAASLRAQGLPEDQIESALEAVLILQNQFIDGFWEGDGALFRSFSPTTESKRYFPKLSSIVNGTISSIESRVIPVLFANDEDDLGTYEVLPHKTRALNFGVTVWDNSSLGGGMATDLISFSSTEQAGPFTVTTTFDEPSYNGFSNVNVQWDVANTNAAPVNCENVTILYSTDGGEQFDIVLTDSTPNDGEATVKLPNIATNQARIMVQAADNIFFNVNDRNFTVTASQVDVPASPTTLIGNRVNPSLIELSWTDGGDLEDGFIIERQIGSNSFEEIARTSVNNTSYTDRIASDNESYSYRVAAFNATGNSDYTNVVSFDISLASGTDIVSFELTEQTGEAIIDTTSHTVSIEVALGTDLTSLTPNITLSEGATSFPANGTIVDFTNPVNYTVSAEDGITVQEWVVTVVAGTVLGLGEERINFKFYPNPATDVLHVETDGKAKVYLTDLNGRKVTSEKTGENLDLNLKNLGGGLYLLVLQNNKSVVYTRITKQ